MNHNRLHALKKLAVLALSVSLLTLAAFGLGLSVGMHFPAGLAASPVSAERASLNSGAAQTGDGGASGEVLLDLNLFREAWGLLQKQFYGNLPQGEDITYDAIRGVVDRLDDAHTSFSSPKDAAMLNSSLAGSFEGIGAGVEKADNGGVRITYVYVKQPAQQAGLLAGDIITAVDGKDITRLDLNEAVSLIRGPKGTQVKLTVQRDGEKPFDVPVTRARIEIPVVELKTFADGRVAYIALSEFNSQASDRLGQALHDALKQQPAGLILDLRGNPGGLLTSAVQIASYFVPAGKVPADNIVLERFKDGTEHDYRREGTYLLGDTRLVVLVNGGSASASEIVAGAIQDAGTGVLLGEKTYGKGSVQLLNTLSDDSQLRVTVAHWFTPNGRGIDGDGLKPDISVALTKDDVQAKRDPQLDQAMTYLLGDRALPATPAATPPSGQ